MRIGIVSDTHGRLPLALRDIFADVDYILHAGDICGQSVIDELETIAPLVAVYGNCDYDDYGLQHFSEFTLGGTRFAMTHKPGDLLAGLSAGWGAATPGASLADRTRSHGWWGERGAPASGAAAAGRPLPHIAVHGHTHQRRQERRGALLLLCPGSPVSPKDGEPPAVIILETSGGVVHSLRFVAVS